MSHRTLERNVPSLREVARASAERNRRQAEQIRAIMPNGLAAFVESAFEGTNALVNVGAAASWEVAQREIVATIEPHLDTRLNEQQRSKIGMEVVLFWNRRAEMRRALLEATQRALHNPMFTMGAR